MPDTLITLSAFADEIGPDPNDQINLLDKCSVKHIELRSIYQTNVLNLTDEQVRDFKKLLDARGFKLSAIGSPIGKIPITDPFKPHLARFKRAIDLCHVFGTPNIRVFSYYLPEGADWATHRQEVMDRMSRKVELAAAAGVRLLHENEHGIYGDDPNRVVDLLNTVNHPNLRAVYDPANYVHDGFDPWTGWQVTKPFTVHFHIKDWIHGQTRGVVAGQGQGRIPDVMADVAKTGYVGFATLEPHLLGGGPTGGVTGPDLFPKAVKAFTMILEKAGIKYN
jgi:sugar phosphate isomerase/epimerase